MAIANNAVQNRNEIPYAAVVMVYTKDFARPGNPIGNVEDSTEGTPSILPLISLADQTGNAIGTIDNPLVTTATLVANSVDISVGDVSLSPGSNAIGTVILGPGANAIGNVAIDGTVEIHANGGSVGLLGGTSQIGSVFQNNAAAFNATVSNAVDFEVTISGSNFDANGALIVNAGVSSGGGGNPAAGAVGSTSPTSAGLTGFTDASGNLQAVSAANPFPIAATAPILAGSGTFPTDALAMGYQNADGEIIPAGAYGGFPVTLGLGTGDYMYGGSTQISTDNPMPITGTVTVSGDATIQATQTYICGATPSNGTLTANVAYPAGTCIGAISTWQYNAFVNGPVAIFNSATLVTNPPQTTTFRFILFYAEPANTYADMANCVIYPSAGGYAAYDSGAVLGVLTFENPVTVGGVSIYTIPSMSLGFNTIGAPVYPPPTTPTTIYGVLVADDATVPFDPDAYLQITITATPSPGNPAYDY